MIIYRTNFIEFRIDNVVLYQKSTIYRDNPRTLANSEDPDEQSSMPEIRHFIDILTGNPLKHKMGNSKLIVFNVMCLI